MKRKKTKMVEKEKETKEEKKEKKELNITTTEGMYVEDAKILLEKEQENVGIKVEGEGKVIVDQKYNYKNDKLIITLNTKKINDESFTYIPNIIGKTKAEVEEIFEKEKIDIKYHVLENVPLQQV